MGSSDPLFDTLFRPTAPSPQMASAAPVRAAGTRSRAGNAMNRTRAALLEGARRAVEVNELIAGLADRPVTDALSQGASSLSENPMLRALARLEPATLAALARVDASAEGWRKAREAVTAVLDRADREGTDMVLRWLASHVMTPASGAAIAADVDILLTGLPARRAAEQAASA
ncbi:MAG TPA: hypothetical protein VEK09_02575 [Jatrophihabitantaceae bacterium]|nr:hypothetical protein [Jatrophihabitantaceae bacterium]